MAFLRPPFRALLLWGLLALIALYPALQTPRLLVASAGTVQGSQAEIVNHLLQERFGETPADETLLIAQSALSDRDPHFQQAYQRLLVALRKVPGVLEVLPYSAPNFLPLTSPNGHLTATILKTSLHRTAQIVSDLQRVLAQHPLPQTKLFLSGASVITQEYLQLVQSDVRRSELLALPLSGLVLLLVFGSLTAVAIPLFVGMLSITVSMGLLWILAHLLSVSSFAQSVITMLCLGAGIDYALMMVGRFREELSRGLSPQAAAQRARQTAGRAVTFSGLTVALAMIALLVPDLTFIRSMGLGGLIGIAVTLLASLTLVPNLFSLLGPWIDRFRLISPRPELSSRFWGRWAERVLRHPWRSIALSALLLLLIASPIFSMRVGSTGILGLAPDTAPRTTLQLVDHLGLGGTLDTSEMLLFTPQGITPSVRQAWRELAQSIARWPQVGLVISPFLPQASGHPNELLALETRSVSQGGHWIRLSIIPRHPLNPTTLGSWKKHLEQVAKRYGFSRALLGGAPIGSLEFTEALLRSLPQALGVVYIATFLLLIFAFRSLLIPLKSIVSNSLTVGAAYGVITLVFQKGVGASWIGAQGLGVIDSTLPILIFAIVFGLSMDYEVFLLTRVYESYQSGLELRQALIQGIERTASVITSAALIMTLVFAAFLIGDVIINKALGLGLAVAVLLDATLVRLVLVPSIMLVAGRWNWWLPRSLARVLSSVKVE
jgi:RND superfamily putative drug exporter